ncbi:MAG: hypothetical protein QXX08_02980 [Candidatus Bathyarchaeia archaeon]
MNKTVTISVKIPEDVYAELILRIPEGERSVFVRDAIIEKLQNTPRPNKILELDRKIRELEDELAFIKRSLADLELLTYEIGKINPHTFCIDQIDHAIINHLIHYKGATTPELAETLKVNRWLVLNHLKRIRRLSERQLGKPVIEYIAREKAGKTKAWWLNEEITNKY